MNREKKILRLILGDQLNVNHSWYKEKSDRIIYLLLEMRQETDYVRHHIQKIIGFFLAMRAFASELKSKGHRVVYLKINDSENRQDLKKNLAYLIQQYQVDRFEYQLPDEYRLDQQLEHIARDLPVTIRRADTEHFLSTREDLSTFFRKKKQYLLENFYRFMRKKYNVLMEDDGPVSGRWNYDVENRKKIPDNQSIPDPMLFNRDVSSLKKDIDRAGISYIGNLDPANFTWPVTRLEMMELLNHFIKSLLPWFGTYQDALTERSWVLFHSRLSFGLNSKLIHPLEIIRKIEDYWRKNSGKISIAQAEGFIRQILGWREYMRGVYWAHMPEYEKLNFFNHQGKLPSWYWNGRTQMRCLSFAIKQSLDYAYAHHIQRLMITGNFGLLAGIHPDEMDAWYLGIYMDAIQWVEITNTRGMSQYADGGIVGTKPYVSSSNYIKKMGNYCKKCHYDPQMKTGEKACPFNSLYWHFHTRNRDLLINNPRIRVMYRTWDKMDPEKQRDLLNQAEDYLSRINEL